MKKNKKISFSIITVIAVLTIVSTGTIAADKYSSMKTFSGKNLSAEQVNKVKEHDTKIQDRYKFVKKDIEETSNINPDNYNELKFDSIFNSNEIKDKSLVNEISKCINEAPIGSFEPIILQKKDNTEIIVAYKLKEGNNIINTFNKDGSVWKKSSNSINGKQFEEVKSLNNEDFK